MDKAWSWTRHTGQSARSYGQHLGNQLKGAMHEAKAAVPEQWSHAIHQANEVASQARDSVTQAKDAAFDKANELTQSATSDSPA